MTELLATLQVDSRCQLGEGILWCAHRQALYWTDILGAELWRHVPASGHTHTWSLPEPLGCLSLAEDGRLLLGLANGLHAADVEAHLHTRTLPLARLTDVDADDPLTRINDGRADRAGGFVFGTKSEYADGRRAGRFYQYTAAHGLRELALPRATIPNSICFDGSGTRMYFCDSHDARIMTCRYDAAAAAVSDIDLFVELDAPGTEPDGSIVDAEDALWNAQWGAGRVVRYLPDGCIDRIVRVPAPQSSCCILRDDTLYVTSARVGLDADTLAALPLSGGVFACRMERPFARPEDRVRLP
ncbi:SMP-30/gluconolactonase/LRE family protein [Marilutibacter alkalisoli]|uniref:SMP-30/gluconolactonase/LRE family protein n=1 Tax=Marilutibacter alkalisoli TaxID=2591633 RepID=A0A514BV66_9GAMM|nr:SMP-30/gluconolactonase/LRE family protein [Lysobacter alkalisoli]QDH71252.1 SMP-30/gluconolactonase/LRE family protein [Lysobacter alkalisoli]